MRVVWDDTNDKYGISDSFVFCVSCSHNSVQHIAVSILNANPHHHLNHHKASSSTHVRAAHTMAATCRISRTHSPGRSMFTQWPAPSSSTVPV